MNYQTTINYEAPRPIKIGDVFYHLQEVDTVNLQAKCKMCDDTHTITVNGITARCPYCGNTSELLRVVNPVVRRYRVYSITDKVDTSEWKQSENHQISIALYRKVGHGDRYRNSGSTIVSIYFLDHLNKREPTAAGVWYSDYAIAVEAAEFLRGIEGAKLATFNEQHGTHHEAHFVERDDPRAK